MKMKMERERRRSAGLAFSLFFPLLCLAGAGGLAAASAQKKVSSSGYRLVSLEEDLAGGEGGLVGILELKQGSPEYGPDIPRLKLSVKHETKDRLRVHITDAEKERWEVPYNLLPRESPSGSSKSFISGEAISSFASSEYAGDELVLSIAADPFSFAVKRRSNGDVLFDTAGDGRSSSSLVFKDQYLEISTSLPETAALYGLGENTQPGGFRLHPGDPYTLYTTDISAINLNTDLYGSHPVYMDLRSSGDGSGGAAAHGVLLLNSNGMDVFYRGTSLTYKIIGGVFDFYFFKGPSPLAVVDQYTSLVGRPAPMPYWAFGFHQCRWGYKNISVVESVVAGYEKAKIPLDVIWNDDDHMDAAKDFTLDPVNYPREKLLKFLDKIHSRGMRYVVLIDPGIAVNSTYGVFRRGMAADVFIKLAGKPYLAQVWPGPVYFPDFLSSGGAAWWADEISRFRSLVPVDGLWIDMNEASNFCSGDCEIPPASRPCPDPSTKTPWICCLDCKNLTSSKFDDPPYKINASGSGEPLGFKTIAASAVHGGGVLEYNAHSLYGLSQAIATHNALLVAGSSGRRRRPFVLTRSTFVGSGAYAAHWTGDNKGTWEDLRYSISTVLNFGIFGVPMVGADICGFYPAPTEELCNRWIELGAFYPFSRDHANFASPPQELYRWSSVVESARNALGLRYKLLPYLYTLGYEAHLAGAPIARPVFFNFPWFSASYNLSTQFMLGSSVMVSPVLEQGATTVAAIFPPGTWYNLFDMSRAVIVSGDGGGVATLSAALNEVNVHVYQNTVLPMQRGGLVSKDAMATPFTLVVAFPLGSPEGDARGRVLVDDGERPEMAISAGASTYVEFYGSLRRRGSTAVRVWSEVEEGEFAVREGLVVEKIVVLGLEGGSVAGELVVEVDGERVHGVSDACFHEEDPRPPPLMSPEAATEDGGDGDSYGEGGVEKRSVVVLRVGELALPLGKKFSLAWNMSSKE